MPFVVDILHEQSVVEFDGSGREPGGVFEEAREHVIHLEWSDMPVLRPQFKSIELPRIGGVRVAERTAFEKCGGCFNVREHGPGLKRTRRPTNDLDTGLIVVASIRTSIRSSDSKVVKSAW